MTEARNEDYWETLDQDRDDPDAISIMDHVRADATEWDILAADVAGESEDGEILFLLVIRRRANDDGHLILSERYYRFDLAEREGNWLKNGIERRVSGSLGAALRVLYAATTNGDSTPDSPMLLDSREDGLDHSAEILTDDLNEMFEPEPEVEHTEGGAKRVSVHETVGGQQNELHGAEASIVCEQCGQPVDDKSAALNIGAALGQDAWIHHRCPEEEDDDE